MLVIDGLAVISSFENGASINAWLGVQSIPWDEIHQASDWALIAIYLSFIGMTLDSGLVAPLKGKTTRASRSRMPLRDSGDPRSANRRIYAILSANSEFEAAIWTIGRIKETGNA